MAAEVHILYGKDDFSLRGAYKEMRRLSIPSELWESNVIPLEGATLTSEALLRAGGVVPFLAPKRMVVVDGFLSRFETPGFRGRRRLSAREPRIPQEWSELPALVKQMPDTTVIVFLDGDIHRDNPVLAVLKAVAKVREFPPLRGARLSQWIQKEAKEKGVALSPPVVNLLASLVGSNLWIMSHELEKLAVYGEGKKTEEADVRRLVAQSREADIFEIMNAALAGNGTKVVPLLKQLLQEGEEPIGVLNRLAGEIRLLIQVKSLQMEDVLPQEIGSRLGIGSDFRLSKLLEQSSRLSLERLKKAYAKVMEADVQIVRGTLPQELALYLLVGTM